MIYHRCPNLPDLAGAPTLIFNREVINGSYMLNDFLNHGDVGHQIQLRNDGDLRILLFSSHQQHILNSLFSIDPSIRGMHAPAVQHRSSRICDAPLVTTHLLCTTGPMAYQLTCAEHHHSVFLRINYDSYICL